MSKMIIAIDGPVGSGKSTVARRVSELLGYTHLDSGAMYRGVAWKALRDGVPLDSPAQLAALAAAGLLELGKIRVKSFGLAEFRQAIEAAASMQGLDLTALLV